jgi:hypothetical protein
LALPGIGTLIPVGRSDPNHTCRFVSSPPLAWTSDLLVPLLRLMPTACHDDVLSFIGWHPEPAKQPSRSTGSRPHSEPKSASTLRRTNVVSTPLLISPRLSDRTSLSSSPAHSQCSDRSECGEEITTRELLATQEDAMGLNSSSAGVKRFFS